AARPWGATRGGTSEYGRFGRRPEVRRPACTAGLDARSDIRSRTTGGKGSAMKFGAFAAAAAVVLTACGSTGTTPGSTQEQPPTATMKPQTSIGAGEGQLNLVVWDGYADKSWANPFTAATGCKLNVHPAGSSDEMASLMEDGVAGQWDMVSASGDADLRRVYGGEVTPLNRDSSLVWLIRGDTGK